MAVTNLAVAEEALSLSPAERTNLARLMIHGFQDDPRTDLEIKADLVPRLENMVSCKDSVLMFEEVIGSPQ